jgi:hypothetical protein
MTVLYHIELFLDGGSYSKEDRRCFIFKSRSICNYLERALKAKQFETTFSRINITCIKNASKAIVQQEKEDGILDVCIAYEMPSPMGLDVSSINAHITHILDSGLQAASTYIKVPHSFCMEVLQRFKDNGFVNEWLQASKKWPRENLESFVRAELTVEKFTLYQQIFRNNRLLGEKQIGVTKPREMLFEQLLGTLSIDRSGDIVYKKKKRVLSKFCVETCRFADID